MADVFKKAMGIIAGGQASDGVDPARQKYLKRLKRMSKRELLQFEGELGGEIFGQVEKGRQRTFFNVDKKTWVWSDQVTDKKTGQVLATTIRYEIQPNGSVLKITDGPRYTILRGAELANFRQAVQVYYEKISQDIYNRDPRTGQKMS